MNESIENNPGGMSPLHLAAAHGDLARVEQLLLAGANPHALNIDGQPPLFNTLENPDPDSNSTAVRETIFRILWEATTSEVRTSQDNKGHNVLQFMAVYGFDKLVREVLEQEPTLASCYMKTTREYPIHTAIVNNQLDVAKALFNTDPETPTRATFKNQLPIHYAARHSSLDMAKLCYEHHKDDIDKTDNHGKTALAWAMESKRSEIQDYLIQQGSDKNLVNSRTTTMRR